AVTTLPWDEHALARDEVRRGHVIVEADQRIDVDAPLGGDAVVGIAVLDPVRAHHPRAGALALGRHLGGLGRRLPRLRDDDDLARLHRPTVRHVAGAIDAFRIDAELGGNRLDGVARADFIALLTISGRRRTGNDERE